MSSWAKLAAGERLVYQYDDAEPEQRPDGNTMNHTCLRTSDPDLTLGFYREVLGFLPVLAWNTGPQTCFFLAQPVSGLPMSEVFKSMQSREGLLEILYLHSTASDPRKPQQPAPLGFFHIGITVVSVADTLERTRDFYRSRAPSLEATAIIKPLGLPQSMEVMGMPKEAPRFHPGTDRIFSQVAFIADPDGNWVELVPKGMHAKPH